MSLKAPTHTVNELLRHRARHDADSVGYVCLDRGEDVSSEVTYSELYRRSCDIAAELCEHCEAGEPVLLLCPSPAEFVLCLFACLNAGAVAVPSYPPAGTEFDHRLKSIIEDASIRVALGPRVIQSRMRASMPEVESGIQWIAPDEVCAGSGDSFCPAEVEPSTAAILQYTSGSTGEPKGVVIAHSQIMANAEAISDRFQMSTSSRGQIWLPLSHDMGLVGGVLVPLYVGFPNVLMSPLAFLQRPARWLKAISRWKVTVSGGPSFAYGVCADRIEGRDLEGVDLSSWNVAFCGAENVCANTLRKFARRFAEFGFDERAFLPCYGLAESTLMVSASPVSEPLRSRQVCLEHLGRGQIVEADQNYREIVSCGRPSKGHKILIVDPEQVKPLADGLIGEIWIDGPSVAAGYFNRPDETERVFHANHMGEQHQQFLRTGDLGFLHNRNLYITGRLSDRIRIRGRNYYPEDIESTLHTSHGSLAPKGAAFSVLDGEAEHLVVMCEVRRSVEKGLDAAVVIDDIRKSIVAQHRVCPDAIVLLKPGMLPKTPNGKSRRHACRCSYINGNHEICGIWKKPATGDSCHARILNASYSGDMIGQEEIEGWLIHQLIHRLGVPVDNTDHRTFAELGMDSVDAVSLSGDLGKWLGTDISPTVFYEHPTISKLAASLTRRSVSRMNLRPRACREGIAVIGMACHFPGANTPEAYWQLLRDGRTVTGPIPESRRHLIEVAYGSQLTDSSIAAFSGGFLDHIDEFDADFFGCSAAEAEAMDPQQRQMLEVAWEAIENAGLVPSQLRGTKAAVYMGVASNDYTVMTRRNSDSHALLKLGGNSASLVSNRLSQFFDLRGPSHVVDTACSSSLVAIHHACESLRQHECDLAFSGGVNILLDPELNSALYEAGMLSPSGECRPFDEDAQGYVRGEGCGVVVLKRLSDARNDNDNVLAIIKGSAVGHNGMTNGLTAPSSGGQYEVLEEALLRSGLLSDDVGYIETHGTGTPLGDPIEIAGLSRLYGASRSGGRTCLGSTKANIGHLEAAAGVAGLIKSILAVEREEIPPQPNFNSINQLIQLDECFCIPEDVQTWQEGSNPAAACSSFGFGGTNAHLIVQKATANGRVAPGNVRERSAHLFTMSAKSESALRELARRYVEFLNRQGDSDLPDICYSTNSGRSHFSYRFATVVTSCSALCEELSTLAIGSEQDEPLSYSASQKSQLAIVLAQSPRVTSNGIEYLCECVPEFRMALQECDAAIAEQAGGGTLLQSLGTDQKSSLPSEVLEFALLYSLCRVLLAAGVSPLAIIGRATLSCCGDCIAGALSINEAMDLLVRGESSSTSRADADLFTVSARLSRAARANPKAANNDRVSIGDAVETAQSIGVRDFVLIAAPAQLEDAFRDTPDVSVCSAFSGTSTINDLLPHLLNAVQHTYVHGADVRFDVLDSGNGRTKTRLPNYPFDRRTYWLTSTGPDALRTATGRTMSTERASGETDIATSIALKLQDELARMMLCNPEELDIYAGFNELGADSIAIAGIAAASQKQFGVEIGIRRLLEELPTLHDVATYIAGADAIHTDSVVLDSCDDCCSPTHAAEEASDSQQVIGAAKDLFRRQMEVMQRQIDALDRWIQIPENRPADTAEIREPEPQRSQDNLRSSGVPPRASDYDAPALAQFIRSYETKFQCSKAQAQESRYVHADNRLATGFRSWTKELQFPIFATRSEGPYFWDADGNRFIDVSMGFGVNLFGHSPDFVFEQLTEQLRNGFQLGPHTALAVQVAKKVADICRVERVAFCNSGTEAVMTALRLARAVSGRQVIAMFRGSYHGHFDGTLAGAHGESTHFAVPITPGTTGNMLADVLLLDYGNPESFDILNRYRGKLAGVLVEPIQSRRPGLQPREFVQKLRQWTDQHGCALIFDEMITGFRLHPRGAQAWYKVDADIVTYGKIAGGGLPIGIVAGSGRYLDAIDGGVWQFGDDSQPHVDSVFFAGTFCKHPLTMSAANAVLDKIVASGPALQSELNAATTTLVQDINALFESRSVAITAVNCGSLFRFESSLDLTLFYCHLVFNGVYVWEGRTCFLSTAHQQKDIQAVLEAIEASIDQMIDAKFLVPRESGRNSAPVTNYGTASRLDTISEAATSAPDYQHQSRRYPLTPSQRHIWNMVNSSYPAAQAFSIGATVRLGGPLNGDILHDALNWLARRHESMRAVVDSTGTEQIILPMAPDLVRTESPSRQMAKRSCGADPCIFFERPLYKCDLTQLGPAEHALTVNTHYLVSDGWSLELLFRELWQIYSTLVTDEEPQLDPAIQFEEYCKRMGAVIDSAPMQKHRVYWRRRLEDFANTSPLPSDFTHETPQTWAGLRHSTPIAESVRNATRQRCATLNVTEFAFLFAAFELVMYSHFGTDRVLVGVPTSGRDIEGSESVVGHCANILPVVIGRPQFDIASDHIREVGARLKSTLAHRAYPFSQILEKDLDGWTGDRPFFNVTFNKDRAIRQVNCGPLTIGIQKQSIEFARYDLTFNIFDNGPAGVTLDIDYRTEVFAEQTIAKLAQEYTSCLELLTRDHVPCS